MKVKKEQAVSLLKALGFSRASEWDEGKITLRMNQVATKVSEDQVPKEFKDLYVRLVEADELKDPVTLGEEPPEPQGEVKQEKAQEPAPLPPMPPVQPSEIPARITPFNIRRLSRRILLALIEMRGWTIPHAETMPLGRLQTQVFLKATGGQKRVPKPPKPRDRLGNRLNTVSAKVNSILLASPGNWVTDYDIAEKIKAKITQVRARLYLGVCQGVFEHRRLLQYRLPKNYSRKTQNEPTP